MREKRDGDDAIRKLDRMEYGYKRRPLRVEWAKVSTTSCLTNHSFASYSVHAVTDLALHKLLSLSRSCIGFSLGSLRSAGLPSVNEPLACHAPVQLHRLAELHCYAIRFAAWSYLRGTQHYMNGSSNALPPLSSVTIPCFSCYTLLHPRSMLRRTFAVTPSPPPPSSSSTLMHAE